jgi:hypothetical protein
MLSAAMIAPPIPERHRAAIGHTGLDRTGDLRGDAWEIDRLFPPPQEC